MQLCLLFTSILMLSPLVMTRTSPVKTAREVEHLQTTVPPEESQELVILSKGWVRRVNVDSDPQPLSVDTETADEAADENTDIAEIPTSGNKTHQENLQIGAQVVADMKTVVGIVVHVTEQIVSIIDRNNSAPYYYTRETCQLRVSYQNKNYKESPVNCATMERLIRTVEDEPAPVEVPSNDPLKLLSSDISCMFIRILPDASVLEKKIECGLLQAHAQKPIN